MAAIRPTSKRKEAKEGNQLVKGERYSGKASPSILGLINNTRNALGIAAMLLKL